MSDNRPIGVFDSGIGGLIFAKEIKRLLPNESIIYFGDTKNLPYGDKSNEDITKLSIRITQFLKDNDCKAILIACNSAVTSALKEIRRIAGKNIIVIDVISPVAEKISFELREKIGVIATKTTVKSKAYKKAIRKRNKHIEVVELATPLLVPVVEEGFANTPISKVVLENYLYNKKLKGIDSLVLGCTHYTHLEKEINQLFNKKVNIINSPLIVVNYIIYLLLKNEKLAVKDTKSEYSFYISYKTDNFVKTTKKIFGKDSRIIEKNLEHY